MYLKLIRSALALVAVLAIGGAATFALFTSNTVTVAATTATTGQADLKLCDADSATNDWQTLVSPGFTVDNLVPGGLEIELLNAGGSSNLFIGNDDGNLDALDELTGKCNAYGADQTPGDSSVAMNILPVFTNISCPTSTDEVTLKKQLQIQFETEGVRSILWDLTKWETLIDLKQSLRVAFEPGDAKQVKMFASLKEEATDQNVSCTFDMNFTGEQVDPTPEEA